MKKILFLSIWGLGVVAARAQLVPANEILYTYDAAGNRIQRTQMMVPGGGGPGSGIRMAASGSLAQPSAESRVYPNPTAGDLHIWLGAADSQEAQVELFDTGGRLLLEAPLSAADNKLSLAHLPPGTYLLLVRSGQRLVLSDKIVLQP